MTKGPREPHGENAKKLSCSEKSFFHNILSFASVEKKFPRLMCGASLLLLLFHLESSIKSAAAFSRRVARSFDRKCAILCPRFIPNFATINKGFNPLNFGNYGAGLILFEPEEIRIIFECQILEMKALQKQQMLVRNKSYSPRIKS